MKYIKLDPKGKNTISRNTEIFKHFIPSIFIYFSIINLCFRVSDRIGTGKRSRQFSDWQSLEHISFQPNQVVGGGLRRYCERGNAWYAYETFKIKDVWYCYAIVWIILCGARMNSFVQYSKKLMGLFFFF